MITKTRLRKMNGPTYRQPGDGERQSSASGMTLGASIVGGASPQGATAGDDTVTTPASNGPQGRDGASLSVSPDTVAIRLVVAEVSQTCEHCGAGFVAHRAWARFCSAYCRRRAWLNRNPEKAAALAERDKARLRAHIIGNDGEWVEGGKVR